MSLCGKLVALVCVLISLNLAAGAVSEFRWCTISSHEEAKCANMKAAFAAKNLPTLLCVAGQSVQDCMEKIKSNKADLITLDGGDVYVAGKDFNMIPIMQEVYASGSKGYYAVAVVKKSNAAININNLEGKKSCHTGVRKTAGWNVPIGYLLENNKINPTDCQDDIRAAGNFFNQSCAPGALSSNYDPNDENPHSLCALCQNTLCPRDSTEPYYNYDGAFRCLVEGGGDVAFIKPITVTSNTDGHSSHDWASALRSDDYELLCQDGTRNAVTDYANCNLAFVPSHAVMASKNYADAVLQDFRKILRDAQDLFGDDVNPNGFSMFDSPSGQSDLLFKDSTQSLDDVVGKEYTEYLGADYLGTIQGLDKCPANTLRWCVTSQAEKTKCSAMKAAFTGAGLTPPLSCYLSYPADNACASDISKDVADLVTLDGGKLFQYGKEYGVVPIMAEDYGIGDGDASYFAVAVVKRTSSFTINDLKGKKSCHTGYMRTAGWIVPIGFLVNRGDITADDKCEIPKAVGQFFSQSCVPSVMDPVNNPNGNNPANLCALCNGAGENNCKGNDPYAGYDGAFRCLLEDAGDVAFVKHSTVPDNAANPPSWATGLNKADYQLLCPDGTRADVDNYMDCNLAKVPSHTVVTSGQKTSGDKSQMVTLLQNGQDQFKSDTGSGFKMFDSSDASYGQHQGNLIFKDSTNQLVATGDKNTYEKFLSKEYLEDVSALHCEPGPNDSSATILPSLLLLLVAAVINRLLRG